MLHRMDPRARCWREMCFKEEEEGEEEERSSRKPGNEILLFFDGRSLSLSLSQHLLKSAAQRNLVVVVSLAC